MSETLVERIHALARKCAEQDAMLKALIAEVNVESLEKPYTAYKANPADIELNKLQDGALVVTDSPATTNFRLPNVGEIVTSLTPLDDPALHLLNGAKLSLDGMYREGLLKIIALQNTHPNLFVTESDWQTSVATYNVCGKFVYDSVANTVRLPLVTGFMEGTIDSSVLGDLVEAGLPNIEGAAENVNFVGGNTLTASGAIRVTSGATANAGSGTSFKLKGLTFNAANYNPIYDNSDTVQPQSTKVFYYIVLANTISTPVVADIQREVDTKVSAVEAAHAVMPSGQYIDLTLPASGGTVTAPADGWVSVSKSATAVGQFLTLSVSSNNNKVAVTITAGASNSSVKAFLPVSSGDEVRVGYSVGGNTEFFVFSYANGTAPTSTNP